MKVLVLNCGSSSLKYQLFDGDQSTPQSLAKGEIEKIGSPGSPVPDYERAIEIAFQQIFHTRVLDHERDIQAVGHRVVHGGERFQESILMTDDVVQDLEELSNLAPLHNPANLEGYRAARKRLPHAKHVAVFDTAFHATLPPRAFLYGLPYRLYEEDKIRRYGFHGTSHRYVSQRYAELVEDSTHRIVSCHLGNGCSVAAIRAGVSIDTSMGFTPLDGLLMGTRAGEIDPGAVLHWMRIRQLSPDQVENILNHECGLLGVSGVSNDMREILSAADRGNRQAQLAIDLFCYRVCKYIGAYAVVLGGLDAIVFEGGIGENAAKIRSMICEGLTILGVDLDERINTETTGGKEGRISSLGSASAVWVIPTNEELMIVEDTLRVSAS